MSTNSMCEGKNPVNKNFMWPVDALFGTVIKACIIAYWMSSNTLHKTQNEDSKMTRAGPGTNKIRVVREYYCPKVGSTPSVD